MTIPERTFSDFKQAEEYAHELHRQGRYFLFSNEFGVRNEDGYLEDRFVVLNLRIANRADVGRVGIYVGDDE